MTVADYFIDFFITNGVTDVFGYQGGMIAYLFDSMGRRSEEINYHICATEQGAALAACGYAIEIESRELCCQRVALALRIF